MAVDSSSETAKQQLTVCEQAGPACLRKPVMLARIRFLPQGCLAVWKTPYTDLGYPVSHQPCHVTSTKCEEVGPAIACVCKAASVVTHGKHSISRP